MKMCTVSRINSGDKPANSKWNGRTSHNYFKRLSVINKNTTYKIVVFDNQNAGLGGDEVRYYQNGKWYKSGIYKDMLVGFNPDWLK